MRRAKASWMSFVGGGEEENRTALVIDTKHSRDRVEGLSGGMVKTVRKQSQITVSERVDAIRRCSTYQSKGRIHCTDDSAISASAKPAARLSTTEMLGSICLIRDRSTVVSSKFLQTTICSSEALAQVEGNLRKGSVRRFVRSVSVIEDGRIALTSKL